MTRVAIIGGGIGGLTAAIALSRAGVDVSVHEAAAELKEIGAGVALHANAMRVLRAIGVEDGVRKVAGRSEWAVTRNGVTGRVISGRAGGSRRRGRGSRARPCTGRTCSTCSPPPCRRTRCPSASAACRLTPTARGRSRGSPTAARPRPTSSSAPTASTRSVRTALFGPDAPRFTGKICYRSVIPASAVRGTPLAADNGQWLGPHGTIVLYPLRGEELINVVCHYDDASYRHESWVAQCPRDEVLQRYAGWHESLLRLFEAGDTWYKWALYDRDPIPAWTRGRVSLLGDAAHPMLPYLGQGACQAIEDGAVLATALSAPGADADPVAALDRYERTRRPRASRVVLTARERGLSNHLASPLAALRRDLVIAVRKRLNRRDADGRGAAWLAAYDATGPDVLAP